MTITRGTGLDGLLGEDGEYQLGGTLPIAPLYVPTPVALDGDRLIWNYGKGHHRNPDQSLLPGFVALADSQPDAIVRYAQRWGVLHLCDKHLVPITHRVPKFRLAGESLNDGACAQLRCAKGIYEPIERWRYFARHARAILRVVSDIALGRPGSEEDVSTLWNAPARPILRVRAHRRLVTDAVNVWLGLANVGAVLTFHENRVALSFSGGLFGAIGMRLAAAVAHSPGFAFCSACGSLFTPARAPRPDQRCFCRQCGRKAAVRFARRDTQRRRSQTGKEPRRAAPISHP